MAEQKQEEDEYDGPWIEKRIEWKAPNRRRHNVVLFGSWNRFKGGDELEYQGKQIFACNVKLPLGTYVYRFLINAEDWKTHCNAPKTARNGIEYNQIHVTEDSDEEEEDENEEDGGDTRHTTLMMGADGKLTMGKKRRGRPEIELDLGQNFAVDTADDGDETDGSKKKRKKRGKKKRGKRPKTGDKEQDKEWAKYVFVQQLRLEQQHKDEINRVKTLWKQERQVRVEMHKKVVKQLKESKSKLQEQSVEIERFTKTVAVHNKSDLNLENVKLKVEIEKLRKQFENRQIEQKQNVKEIAVVNEDINSEEIMSVRMRHGLKCLSAAKLIESIPLYACSAKDISMIITSWILNDIQHIKITKKLIEIAAKEVWSGTNLKQYKQYLSMLLGGKISQYMTSETFDIVCDYLTKELNSKSSDIFAKNSAEIAQLISDYPLSMLQKTIENKKIDGAKVIKFMQSENILWIQECTGWSDDEIRQIISILLKQKTLTKDEIQKLIRQKLSQNSAQFFFKQCDSLDLTKLQLNIKNGKNIENETVLLMNMIQDLQTQSKDATFIQKIYHLIAETLSMNHTHGNWVCRMCKNCNFPFNYGSRLHNDLYICRLCGIKQVQSCVLALKGADIYQNIGNDEDDNNPPIVCPNSTNLKQSCHSIPRLVKRLLFYQKWLKMVTSKNNKNSVEFTTTVDINKLDNNNFKRILINCANELNENVKMKTKIKIKELEDITSENIVNVTKFISLMRKDFIKLITANTTMKFGILAKLYKLLTKSAKTAAFYNKFGTFFSDLESVLISADYHHILNVHIQKGSKYDRENVFRHFQEKIRCEHESCNSVMRQMQRAEQMNADNVGTIGKSKQSEEKSYDEFDKNVWSKNQEYVQSTLDIIHSFLVHSDSHQSHDQGQEEADNDEKDEKMEYTNMANTAENNDVFTKMSEMNKHKFVTDTNAVNQYGFGLDHNYLYLKGEKDCIREEVINHSKASLSIETFDTLLTKALKMQPIAHKVYELKCTHYDPDYNIIRNEPIGIRHLLAISIYTDISLFCRAYRETFRKLTANESELTVTQRHRQLYWYSRAMFEALEFFGKSMPSNMIVYHGLNQEMGFERFTAYFNQPISTTMDIMIAKQFAEDNGIVLTFRSSKADDESIIPHYMDVRWLSAFPNEDERLFYGQAVLFQICDIMESNTNAKHQKELKMLNLFQELVTNKPIEWDGKPNKIKKLIHLVKKRKTEDTYYVEYAKGIPKNSANTTEEKPIEMTRVDPAAALNNIIQELEVQKAEAGQAGDEARIDEIEVEIDQMIHKLKALSIKDLESISNNVNETANQLINHEIEYKKRSAAEQKAKEQKKEVKVSAFAERLFNFFCSNESMKSVRIHNFERMDASLREELLQEYGGHFDYADNAMRDILSFYALSIIFPNCEKIEFNDLNLKTIAQNCGLYVKSVTKYIKYLKKNQTSAMYGKLNEIKFESHEIKDDKKNSTLRKIVMKKRQEYNLDLHWTIRYEYDQRYHKLIFKKN